MFLLSFFKEINDVKPQIKSTTIVSNRNAIAVITAISNGIILERTATITPSETPVPIGANTANRPTMVQEAVVATIRGSVERSTYIKARTHKYIEIPRIMNKIEYKKLSFIKDVYLYSLQFLSFIKVLNILFSTFG